MPYRDSGRNRWRAVARVDGKRVTRLFDTKKAAIQWENDCKRGLDQRGTPLIDRLVAYLDFAENEFTEHTYKRKRRILRRFRLAAGTEVMMEDIDRGAIHDHLMAVLQDQTAHVANEHRKHIKAFFRWCEETYGDANPASAIKKFRAEPVELRTPTIEEVDAILAAASGDTLVWLQCYLYTGGREQEINRLKWEDVDFAGERIRLWSRKTKSRNFEPRWIHLSPTLAASLAWWKRQPQAGAVHVFENRDGQPYRERQEKLKRACEAAGVEKFTFHPMRRFVGSYLAKDGASMREIQHVLGHASLAHTERYVKGLDVDVTGAILRLERKKDTPEDTQGPVIQ